WLRPARTGGSRALKTTARGLAWSYRRSKGLAGLYWRLAVKSMLGTDEPVARKVNSSPCQGGGRGARLGRGGPPREGVPALQRAGLLHSTVGSVPEKRPHSSPPL